MSIRDLLTNYTDLDAQLEQAKEALESQFNKAATELAEALPEKCGYYYTNGNRAFWVLSEYADTTDGLHMRGGREDRYDCFIPWVYLDADEAGRAAYIASQRRVHKMAEERTAAREKELAEKALAKAERRLEEALAKMEEQ